MLIVASDRSRRWGSNTSELGIDRILASLQTFKNMKRIALVALVLVAFAKPASGVLNRGDWIGSFGAGLFVNPTLVLIAPQIEMVYRRNLFLGPLIQAGLGKGGALIGTSFAARLMVGQNPRLRPCIELGAGLMASSGLFVDPIGILFHFGMGFDFLLEEKIAIGTIVRANFAPPIQSFVFGWPLVVLRMIL